MVIYERRPENFIEQFVVSGIYLIHANAVLFLSRVKPPFDGTWSSPGGKIDTNESPVQAALRELKEETGITIQSCRHVQTIYAVYPQHSFTFHVCIARPDEKPDVRVDGIEHDDFVWVTKDQASTLPIQETDRFVIEHVI